MKLSWCNPDWAVIFFFTGNESCKNWAKLRIVYTGERMLSKCSRLAILLLVMLSIVSLGFASLERKTTFSNSGNMVQLLNNNATGFELQFKLQDFNVQEIATRSGIYDQISIDGFGYSGRIGEPKLPVFSKLIAVPLGANVQFELVSRSQLTLNKTEAQLKNPLIPAQLSVSKSENPELVPFQKNSEIYASNTFTANEMFTLKEEGIMRAVRVYRFDFEPVRYNPVTGELQLISEAYIRVKFENPDLNATQELMDRTASVEYDQLYEKLFYNWRNDTRLNVNRYPSKILILCPPNYTSTMQTYIDWKKQQGYNVVLTTVGTGGTVANTTSAILTYMAGVWSSATAQDPAPTYLLIVGDTSTSGDNIIANTGASGSHVTDLTYVRLDGTDYLPEMYYGRFSVSSATELTNIINKSLTFQKTLMPDLSYLGKVVMIAGADASYAPTYGNGQINYGTTHYFNSTNGLTSNTYLYPESASSDATIIANANEGRGYMNYTAHGSETSWADPTFTVSDVNAMTNTSKYGVMVGNCCVTNSFGYSSPCFGESIIRKANAGGVAYIGATNNSYWDEDYWWGIGYKTPIQAAAHAYNASTLGAYDAMFHTHSEAQTNWATTVGEINMMGNSAVQQSTSTRKPYYWEIYSIMGDPSTMPYLGVPTVNTATFPTTILIGQTSITVTATAYSRVALTMNGTIYGTAIVPAGGSLTLPITAFSNVGTATLVITAQNKITRIESITIAPNSGAYLTVETNTYSDSNNNVAEYNETGRFSPAFKNVGSVASGTTTATLTCSTSGITITDGSETLAAIASGGTLTVNNAFTFNVANNIVNGLTANFTITMVSGSNTWIHNFTQVFNAPALAFGNLSISDPTGNNNGRLDPGETVTVTMPLLNSGAATSPSGSATLTCSTTGITVNSGTANFAAVSASGNTNLSFTLTAASSVSIGTIANLVFSATAGSYTANKTDPVAVGLIQEDFETGNFNSFPWIMSTTPWVIVNTGAYAGTYAAKSGTITASGSTTMKTTRILSSGGNISFWYKVSSESGYDFLKFYVDGTAVQTWSGTVDWTQYTYALTAGTRVLKWEYMKDGSVDTGSDCAWIDNIIFPASTAPSTFYPPRNLAATPGNGFVNLSWQAPETGTPTGYKIFRNSSLLTTVTGLSYTDNAVVNETTYGYYLKAVYSGGESDPTSTVNATPTSIVATEAIIGTGTSATGTSEASPINVWYQSLHGQAVYTAAELNAAGIVGLVNINQIGFNIVALPTKTMPNFVVRMKHTTATNVASWVDNSSLTTVYTNASYLPTATGYNMLTLSTPFLWNGTDNLLIDTAFGLIGSYASTGTVQYTTVTSGYRYGRSDTVDQTSLFTGGSTSTYRPNLKLAFSGVTANPQISVNPSTITFGSVAVGTVSTQNFTLTNTGGGTLTGSITTPTRYSVTELTRETRNTLSFSLTSGQSKTYILSFAPTSGTSYNGNVVITSNSETQSTFNLAVTGSGHYPPTIVVDAQVLAASLVQDESYSDSFNISNTGSQALNYNIGISEVSRRGTSIPLSISTKDGRNITGSTLTVDVAEFTPGATENWTFTVTNASTDSEWLKDVIITFPAGVTINSATNFVGGDGGDLVPDNTSGNGVTITWHGVTSSGWGVVYGNGDTATATVNVTTSPSLTTSINLPWQLNGDVYGSEPHVLNGSISIAAGVVPVEWFSVDPVSGSIAADGHQTITGYFSSTGLEEGLYEALLTISSNDPVNPTKTVQILLEVAAGNHAPQINLPASFSFDKNGSLVQSFATYISDADSDPLTLSVSGNTNVLVNIAGSSVTFTSTQNWIGSEVLTFGVSDGTITAYDNVTVTVNPVNTPDWTPTVYPNNPATLYAMVTIDGIPAQLNDMVAAFCGNECRGTGEITLIDRSTAYSTLLVNLASSGETITFKIYSYAGDTIYPVQESMPMNTGAVYGESEPVPLNGTLNIVIETPTTTISSISGGARISWNAVPFANNYKVYACSEPYGTYSLIGNTSTLYWDIAAGAPMMFYKVIAEQLNPTKGGK